MIFYGKYFTCQVKHTTMYNENCYLLSGQWPCVLYVSIYKKKCHKLKAINITVFLNNLNDCPFQKILFMSTTYNV